ncbi:MAG TPA: nucleotidyltransferase family protein [Acidimicrobiia bacterium]
MAYPHPALLELTAGRPLPFVEDPSVLVHSAREHRMTGLLWSVIDADQVRVPEPLRAELEQATLHIWGRHVRLWDVLERAAQTLGEIGVEIGTAKGVTAEARWYDQLGHRPCADLDLFIDPGDVARIPEIVQALAPDLEDPAELGPLAQAGLIQAVNLEVEGILVDLHFDILKMGVLTRQLKLVWDRSLAFELESGTSVRVLDPELALIHFLLHLNRSKFQRLLQYVDVVRILEQEDLDWDFVDRLTRGEGIETAVRSTLTAVLEDLDRNDLEPPWRPRMGWRARTWRSLWPKEVRLRGQEALYLYPHRGKTLLPLLYRGRAVEALRTRALLFLPPRRLVDLMHPNESGPYLKRVFMGRLHYARMRQSGRQRTPTRLPR